VDSFLNYQFATENPLFKELQSKEVGLKKDARQSKILP